MALEEVTYAQGFEGLDVDHARPNLTARCPSCGGRYVAGYRKTTRVGFLVHAMPWCDKFTVTPPVEFL
jgi:transposase